MNYIKTLSIIVLFFFQLTVISQVNYSNKTQSLQVNIDNRGQISNFISKQDTVLFRNDSLSGPALLWNGKLINLRQNTQNNFVAKDFDVDFTLSYSIHEDRVAIKVSCTNLSDITLNDITLSLRLGIDTEMKSYPEWRTRHFPTLLRCEKTHFWGYLMSPNGKIITVSSPDPIASYHLLYNNKTMFEHGHLIRGVSLDLLNPDPLPERHPDNLASLGAHQTREWTIYLENVPNMEDIKPTIAKNTKAPVVDADFYTVKEGETIHANIISQHNPKVQITDETGFNQTMKVSQKDSKYYFDFEAPKKGMYTVTIQDTKTGKTSEAKLSFVDKKYSDFIKSARIACLKYPQQASTHTESWYGFFPAYIAKEYFPNPNIDEQVETEFREVYSLLYDTITNLPTYINNRIQNDAMMANLFAQRYRASENIEDLRKAVDLTNFILTKQNNDGSYRNGNVHYTSVIYIAKAIMSVMNEEKKLIDTSDEWARNYNRHYHSVKKAIDDLTLHLDNIDTEGELTFEDGMISCSYTQISEFALLQPEGSEDRIRYTKAAEKLLELHKCLSQLIIPDSRMNGGSIRFWEAQYDILTGPNMVNSPHGWSAWRIYGLKNLYELTGKPEYLHQMMNAIGSCIQLLNPETNNLNWAFIVDPYLEANIFVEDPNNEGKGIYEKKIIGEQYMPMIGDWYKAKPNKTVTGYWGYDGGKCDNDVHEIFKCLGEILLTNAYVLQNNDGSFEGYNCQIEKTTNGILITPDEDVVSNLHYNVKTPMQIEFKNKITKVENTKMGWISTK